MTDESDVVAPLQAAEAATEPPVVNGRFLYHSNYYDGPISGAMLAETGERYWFDAHPDADPYNTGYWYLLYELTPDEWELETRRHDLFRRYVGTHCDYDENGRRNLGGVNRSGEHDKFYDDPELGGYRRGGQFDYTGRPPVAAWDPRGHRPDTTSVAPSEASPGDPP